jgi:AcrR family transcriptional regulator
MAVRAAAMDEKTIPDGRVRRGARNREAIVNALFDLIGEGELQPTAEQVAARAGVQVRTVFRHFEDMASLNGEISSRLGEQIRPILQEIPRSGSLTDRARALVRARAAVFERIAPYKRSSNSLRWRVDYLQRNHEEMVREQRRHLGEVFPELESAPATALSALELVTSFEAWERLRVDQRLGVDRARAAMEHATLAVLATLSA